MMSNSVVIYQDFSNPIYKYHLGTPIWANLRRSLATALGDGHRRSIGGAYLKSVSHCVATAFASYIYFLHLRVGLLIVFESLICIWKTEKITLLQYSHE